MKIVIKYMPKMTVEMLPYWRDRFQDIAEDADDLSRELYGKPASEIGGLLGGIRAVADLATVGMTAHIAALSPPAECPSCDGRGEVPVNVFDGSEEGHAELATCDACKGTGRR